MKKDKIDYLALIPKMQLTSDLLFGAALENTEVCEEVVHIVTEIRLEVLEVKN